MRMFSDVPGACDTFENPNAILPKVDTDTRCDAGVLCANPHKLSWNAFRFGKRN